MAGGHRRTPDEPGGQGIIAPETLAAVALGELLAFTLLIQREFGVFDPVGAFVGIRRASRPQVAPQASGSPDRVATGAVGWRDYAGSSDTAASGATHLWPSCRPST